MILVPSEHSKLRTNNENKVKEIVSPLVIIQTPAPYNSIRVNEFLYSIAEIVA